MKKRNGFVSNSSSSSFIIGVASVNDYEKFNEWFKKIKDKSDIELINSKEINEENYFLSSDEEYINVYAPVNSNPSVYLKKSDIKKINIAHKEKTKMLLSDNFFDVVAICIGNDEGDAAFYTDSESYDLDYDIDLDFFPEVQQELYKGLSEENGLTNIMKIYGVDRNG